MKKNEKKYVGFMKLILENKIYGGIFMKYVEISIEEAMKRCKKNTKVLVAEQDLENDDCEVIFISKGRKDYRELFKDVQTAASLSDDLVKQLRLFTEHQDILNIRPQGIQKIVLMRE